MSSYRRTTANRVARKLAVALATSTCALSLTVPFAPALMAQDTAGSLRGTIAGADASSTVTAIEVGTGASRTVPVEADGSYLFASLRPGTYRLEVTTPDGMRQTDEFEVRVAQDAVFDFDLAEGRPADPGVAAADGNVIIVTGGRVRAAPGGAVGASVSQEQIKSLPQTDRNFLSFAALSPGVVYLDSETDKGIQSGASTRSQVNVFIDGVSLKNKLREGGIAGQQNSRGNPFGQLAVQEFRVLTQNYKAEYEEAGSAIVTAVTKSGTNKFHGEAFAQYTDRSLTEIDVINARQDLPEPPFERKQYGISLGGPIIKDKLFFFAAYEGNDQDRAFNVIAGGTPDLRNQFEASSGRSIDEFEGAFVSPFRGDFYFGKLTLTPDDRQIFDLSFSRREETDIQNFGGQTSFEAAENKKNRVDSGLFKWTYQGDDFTNEFSASMIDYVFNPTSINPGLPQFQYIGVLTFGGKDSTRREQQQSYTIRDDFTYSGFADHTIKFGARVEVLDIEFDNRAFVQPRYTFFVDDANNLDFRFPAEARLGLGNSLITASNTSLGLYIQDDWQVTDRLELNLGVRWDYETNGFNNDYVTPAAAAAALRALPSTFYFDPEDYITDGTERDPFMGAIAPRFGFSYDLSGDGTTILFGGAGRYYDRNTFSNTVDEIARLRNPVGVFRFSEDGSPRNGLPTVAWDPSYLTRDGLIALRETSTSGLPELFAVPENAKPPVNDQFSLGIRHRFGDWEAALTGSYQRGRNGYTHLFATRRDGGLGNCCDTSPVVPFGFANVLIGFDGLDTRYKALFATLDKNYTEESGWGLNIAYTLSKGEQNGNDLFSLDGTVPDSYGWRARPGDERHRVVISGLVDLPWGFRFSTLSTFGSGRAYQVVDATDGFDNGQLRITSAYPEKTCVDGVFQFCEVNLTLAKFIEFGDDREIELAVDLLNAFDNPNYSGFDGFFNSVDPLDPANGEFNPQTNRYNASSILTLPRRIQFRAAVRF
ncbi:MAG: TonB-dependent receptor [Erythrobacter sp.]|uniref:TonB-dependent receptor n=1 Tax=Erythrobacter sp. TaxID=1042 RepID=UPI001AFD09BE|nr:TonB-dependent receptor [Erythrobacter sp.]MBO6769161.1 TonB-dependent receptor [Erythrobacter sp.]